MKKDSKNTIEIEKPKFYKLFIEKYCIFIDDYAIVERIVCTKDLYHEIGLIYCTSIGDIKSIEFYEIEEKNEKR